MGYEVVFKPTEEVMESYHDKGFSGFTTPSTEKLELLLYCLQGQDEKTQLKDIILQIKFYLQYLATLERREIRESCYKQWKDSEEKEFWFCGWGMAEDCRYDEDSVTNNTIEDLAILKAIVKVPDYLEDAEKFNELRNEINDQIEGFIECIDDLEQHKIKEELKEFIVSEG